MQTGACTHSSAHLRQNPCTYAWRSHAHTQAYTHTPKVTDGERQGDKYVLKGEGNVCGLGNVFHPFKSICQVLLELRYQKSRVFPCKLPSLISLSDMLHCTTTHQRLCMRWAKGSKPRWEQSLCTPEHRGLPHSLSCQIEGRERGTQSKDLHRLHNLRRFMPSPTPTLRDSLNDFLLPLYLSRVSLHFLSVSLLCTFLSHSLRTCTPSTISPIPHPQPPPPLQPRAHTSQPPPSSPHTH